METRGQRQRIRVGDRKALFYLGTSFLIAWAL